MRITVTTTSTKLSDLITTAGYKLGSIANSLANKDGYTSFAFDLDGANIDDIRFEIGRDATLTDSPRLGLFPAMLVNDPNKTYLIASAPTDVLLTNG